MLKQMLLGLGAASLLVVVTAMPVQAVPLILPPELIVLGTKADTGQKWEWVWVSTCPEGRPSCSFTEAVDNHGFAPPVIAPDGSSNPWTESFTDYTALAAAFIPSDNLSGNCAYNVFNSDYLGEPCGTGDLNMGLISEAPVGFAPVWSSFELNSAEVFWVRAYEGSAPAPLPEPSSLLLLGAGLLGLAAWRWKHTA